MRVRVALGTEPYQPGIVAPWREALADPCIESEDSSEREAAIVAVFSPCIKAALYRDVDIITLDVKGTLRNNCFIVLLWRVSGIHTYGMSERKMARWGVVAVEDGKRRICSVCIEEWEAPEQSQERGMSTAVRHAIVMLTATATRVRIRATTVEIRSRPSHALGGR